MVAVINYLKFFTQKLIRIVKISFVNVSHVDFTTRHPHTDILNLSYHTTSHSLTILDLYSYLKLKVSWIHDCQAALQL